MYRRWCSRALWCWLASAGILGATVLSQGTGQLASPPQVLPQAAAVEAWQLYYTPWGPASIVRPGLERRLSGDASPVESDSWRWEEASLYHLTKPAGEAPIGRSKVGRMLLELYESGLNLLPLEPRLRVYASFTGASYDLNAWQRAQNTGLETAGANPLPEPSPLALLVTGLVCIALARGLRRRQSR